MYVRISVTRSAIDVLNDVRASLTVVNDRVGKVGNSGGRGSRERKVVGSNQTGGSTRPRSVAVNDLGRSFCRERSACNWPNSATSVRCSEIGQSTDRSQSNRPISRRGKRQRTDLTPREAATDRSHAAGSGNGPISRCGKQQVTELARPRSRADQPATARTRCSATARRCASGRSR
jgi:hypothetical protein